MFLGKLNSEESMNLQKSTQKWPKCSCYTFYTHLHAATITEIPTHSWETATFAAPSHVEWPWMRRPRQQLTRWSRIIGLIIWLHRLWTGDECHPSKKPISWWILWFSAHFSPPQKSKRVDDLLNSPPCSSDMHLCDPLTPFRVTLVKLGPLLPSLGEEMIQDFDCDGSANDATGLVVAWW